MWVNNKVNPKPHSAVLELPANPQEDNPREKKRESYKHEKIPQQKLQLWKLYNIYRISFVYLGFFLNKNLRERTENSLKSLNNLILIAHYKSSLLKV